MCHDSELEQPRRPLCVCQRTRSFSLAESSDSGAEAELEVVLRSSKSILMPLLGLSPLFTCPIFNVRY